LFDCRAPTARSYLKSGRRSPACGNQQTGPETRDLQNTHGARFWALFRGWGAHCLSVGWRTEVEKRGAARIYHHRIDPRVGEKTGAKAPIREGICEAEFAVNRPWSSRSFHHSPIRRLIS